MRIKTGISLAIIFLFSSCGLFKGAPHQVELNVNETEQYCGGAQPPEEILQELSTPHPVTNRTLYISPESKKTVVVIDVLEGKATTQLKPGKYEVRLFSEEQLKEQLSMQEEWLGDEEECYKQWMRKVVGTFEITKKSESVSFNIEVSCDPCLPAPP